MERECPVDIDGWEKSEEPGGAGFQYVGRRRLSAQERQTLGRRSFWLRLLGGAAVLAFPIVLFIALATGVFIEEAQGIRRAGFILVTLLLFGLTIVLVFAARMFLRESRAVGRDAREGFVERCSGVLTAAEEYCPPLDQILKLGLLKPGVSRVQWFEVLPRSGVLWQVNGVRPRRWIPVVAPLTVDVAEAPPYAAVAAEWVEPVTMEGEALYVGQRELTLEEIRELKRHIRHRVLQPLKIALPCTLWFGAVLLLCLESGRYPTGWNLLMFGWLGVVTAVSNILLISRLLEIRAYRADLRIGGVNIIRIPLSEEAAPSGRPALSEAIEALPVSGETWTVDGQPALWRTVG